MKRLLTICAVVAFLLAVSSTAKAVTWNVGPGGDFATIEVALASPDVLNGHTLLVEPGNHAGALVTKAVEIKAEGGAVINDGPVHSSGLIQGFRILADGTGATISHFTFEVDFPIMAWRADDVTINHCIMTSPVQGITNWEGNAWDISHNVINGLETACGGGIGIFIGGYSGATASNNLVAHNKITGEVVVPEGDCGGYSGPGICLMSDRRGGAAGGMLSGNRIIKNKVSLSSTRPDLVSCVGIELTDMGLEQEAPAPTSTDLADLVDNRVGFNDVRGVTGVPIALNPPEVAEYNKIDRNLGDAADNRGHGLYNPKVFLK